jgi:hypothetical protein
MGGQPAIPFQRNDIPIIGAEFNCTAWYPTAIINCGCAGKTAIPLVGVGQPNACPSCKRAFMIQGIVMTPDGVGINIARVVINRPSENGASADAATN